MHSHVYYVLYFSLHLKFAITIYYFHAELKNTRFSSESNQMELVYSSHSKIPNK